MQNNEVQLENVSRRSPVKCNFPLVFHLMAQNPYERISGHRQRPLVIRVSLLHEVRKEKAYWQRRGCHYIVFCPLCDLSEFNYVSC